MQGIRALHGGTENVARIVGTGLIRLGFNEADFVRESQYRLDSIYPDGKIEHATVMTLRTVAEQVHMIASAIHRKIDYPIEGAEIVIKGPKIRWSGDVPFLLEFEVPEMNAKSVFPEWVRQGPYIIPTVILCQFPRHDLRIVWAGQFKNSFDRTAQLIAEWKDPLDSREGRVRFPNTQMLGMAEYLGLFVQARNALHDMGFKSSPAVSIELKGIDFNLGTYLCKQGQLWTAAVKEAEKLGLDVGTVPSRVIWAIGLTLIQHDTYEVPLAPPAVRILVKGNGHDEFEVVPGETIPASILSLSEAVALNGLKLWHQITV
jgi:hypothetical protein